MDPNNQSNLYRKFITKCNRSRNSSNFLSVICTFKIHVIIYTKRLGTNETNE